jgi:hypothetical protein
MRQCVLEGKRRTLMETLTGCTSHTPLIYLLGGWGAIAVSLPFWRGIRWERLDGSIDVVPLGFGSKGEPSADFRRHNAGDVWRYLAPCNVIMGFTLTK